MVNTLIIDDEALARHRIRRLLENYRNSIHIAGECRNGAEAIEQIRQFRPELIFLDIQMKDMSGFELLKALDQQALPLVIFVTAYDHYAIQAFDVFAFDYLLKPLKEDRFRQSVDKALKQLAGRPASPVADSSLQELMDYLHAPLLSPPDRLSIRLAGKVCFLDFQEIEYIEASGYYIEIVAAPKKYLVRESLAHIQERLDPALFLRIHRSTIINRLFLQEINHLGTGDLEALMRSGKRFRVSRSYKESLRGALNL